MIGERTAREFRIAVSVLALLRVRTLLIAEVESTESTRSTTTPAVRQRSNQFQELNAISRIEYVPVFTVRDLQVLIIRMLLDTFNRFDLFGNSLDGSVSILLSPDEKREKDDSQRS